MRKFLLFLFILLLPVTAWSAEPKAKHVRTDTTNFNNNLSSADDTVQKALETLDNMSAGGSGDMTKAVYDTNNNGVVDGVDSYSETDPIFGAWDKDYGDLINIPTIPSALSDLTDDSTHRLVTDTEKSTWNAKQDALTADVDYLTPGTAASTYFPIWDYDYTDLINKPTIPDELSDLADDSTHRLVTDTEKSTWNAKQDTVTATAPLSILLNNMTIQQAGAAQDGYLSTEDWNTFNTAAGWGDHSSAGYFVKASDTLDDISDGSTYGRATLAQISAWGDIYTLVDSKYPNWDTAYGWGDHSGLYDTIGTASGLISTHESTYNHSNYNTAYSHSQITTGNPHNLDYSDIGLSANQVIDWTGESAGTIHSSNYVDNNTTYTAGNGLQLGGTEFSAKLDGVTLTNSASGLKVTDSTFQPLNAKLTSAAALTYVSESFVKMTGENTFSLDTNTYLTGNQTITLSGDVSGSGTTAITTTIGAGKVSADELDEAGVEAGLEAVLDLQDLQGAVTDVQVPDDITITESDPIYSAWILGPPNVSEFTNDSGYITATLTEEEVEDYVGGMVTGNTETLITVTYQDDDGTIDFVVDNDLSHYDNGTSGFLTSEVDGSTTNEINTITCPDANATEGLGITFAQSGNIAITEDSDTVTFTVTAYTGGDFLTLTDHDFDVDTAAVTNGDTTHLPTCDGVYDFCETTQAYYNAGDALGTPASGTLTNCTGLPISSGVSGLGANVATFLATPSSANLVSAVTGETGTGALVFGTNPTITNGMTFASTYPKKSIYLSAAGATLPTSSYAELNDFAGTNFTYRVLAFDQSSDEKCYWTFPVPDNFTGTTVTFTFYWTTDDGGAAETVQWEVDTGGYANDEAFKTGALGGTALGTSDTWIANGDIHVVTSSAMTCDWTAGDLATVYLFRDVSDDDLGADAYLIGVKIEYSIGVLSE